MVARYATRAGYEERGTTLPALTDPVTTSWDQRLSRDEVARILAGLPYPLSMDDRLLAFCDGPDPCSGETVFNLWYSWGGITTKWAELIFIVDANEEGGFENEGARISHLLSPSEIFFADKDADKKALMKGFLQDHFGVKLADLWEGEYSVTK